MDVSSSIFDLNVLAASLPTQSDTMLIDKRLTDEAAASSRVFRIYRPVPAHFHRTCDEYLLVISGRARVVVDGNDAVELGPGKLLFFRRGIVHSFPEVLEHPLVVFAVDTPRRDPADVTFVDCESNRIETFIQTLPTV